MDSELVGAGGLLGVVVVVVVVVTVGVSTGGGPGFAAQPISTAELAIPRGNSQAREAKILLTPYLLRFFSLERARARSVAFRMVLRTRSTSGVTSTHSS